MTTKRQIEFRNVSSQGVWRKAYVDPALPHVEELLNSGWLSVTLIHDCDYIEYRFSPVTPEERASWRSCLLV